MRADGDVRPVSHLATADWETPSRSASSRCDHFAGRRTRRIIPDVSTSSGDDAPLAPGTSLVSVSILLPRCLLDLSSIHQSSSHRH
ncbi:hypothetical protein [Nocardioides sp. B-3]|uniref:hypothetical protein n=1 Tax=Nocardioides sp. B-3 TaxID=2895565 RepID=UPI0021530AE6|nr:hypothetical protein [Nocardioides sp. B-3]UUZ58931.1 hypothetical protein LP418_23240 [Nocardioides sp. B-3]